MTDEKQYCDGNGYCLKRLSIDRSALAEGWARASTPSPDLKAENAALVEAAIAEFDAADWTDCFPQGATCRDLLAATYGLPQRFVGEPQP